MGLLRVLLFISLGIIGQMSFASFDVKTDEWLSRYQDFLDYEDKSKKSDKIREEARKKIKGARETKALEKEKQRKAYQDFRVRKEARKYNRSQQWVTLGAGDSKNKQKQTEKKRKSFQKDQNRFEKIQKKYPIPEAAELFKKR